MIRYHPPRRATDAARDRLTESGWVRTVEDDPTLRSPAEIRQSVIRAGGTRHAAGGDILPWIVLVAGEHPVRAVAIEEIAVIGARQRRLHDPFIACAMHRRITRRIARDLRVRRAIRDLRAYPGDVDSKPRDWRIDIARGGVVETVDDLDGADDAARRRGASGIDASRLPRPPAGVCKRYLPEAS